METKQKKKLRLKKESLRCLSASFLFLVAGGSDDSSGQVQTCDEACTFTILTRDDP